MAVFDVDAFFEHHKFQLSNFDVQELLGLTDVRLRVGGLEALCVGTAFKAAPQLSIPIGIGQKNSVLSAMALIDLAEAVAHEMQSKR